MTRRREVVRVLDALKTVEGAGVRLHRAFGAREVPLFDPFLMLDDFRADRPEDYLAGFPWHPHRGIETVTSMLAGRVEHGDSIGNAGTIGAGDVQWMTAGSGIVHQEMPMPVDGAMGGFQLWVNLPRAQKMMAPRYREVRAAEIPVVSPAPGVTVRVIAGECAGAVGPVQGIVVDPVYLDVAVEPGAEFVHPVEEGYTVFAYVVDGAGRFDDGAGRFDDGAGGEAHNRQVVLYGDGDEVTVRARDLPLRFLFLSGRPIREPVAWGGPIVMNTEEEVREALREYRQGTFVKEGSEKKGVEVGSGLF
ncbi:pirin family protein [Methanofollis formosanus]|uniref:Pirin family protein n=1 Tax=Methanofollis formosanus TaxID=299308 RepID=A0A8G1EFP2_9EURY|nr:pirin family protein [Methanofollis formosanus]QYZ78344.1 pirin family protein [Methanofollis formosanus]